MKKRTLLCNISLAFFFFSLVNHAYFSWLSAKFSINIIVGGSNQINYGKMYLETCAMDDVIVYWTNYLLTQIGHLNNQQSTITKPVFLTNLYVDLCLRNVNIILNIDC